MSKTFPGEKTSKVLCFCRFGAAVKVNDAMYQRIPVKTYRSVTDFSIETILRPRKEMIVSENDQCEKHEHNHQKGISNIQVRLLISLSKDFLLRNELILSFVVF